MAKVYEFPVKKQLPESIEEDLYEVAKAYMVILYNALVEVGGESASEEELEEIKNMVLIAYAKGVDRAIKEYEESF